MKKNVILPTKTWKIQPLPCFGGKNIPDLKRSDHLNNATILKILQILTNTKEKRRCKNKQRSETII